MKKYVKYIGYKPEQGSYFTTGLTINRYYEFKKLTNEENFIVVCNNLGEDFAYSIDLFE